MGFTFAVFKLSNMAVSLETIKKESEKIIALINED
jgi:hypothetical protein